MTFLTRRNQLLQRTDVFDDAGLVAAALLPEAGDSFDDTALLASIADLQDQVDQLAGPLGLLQTQVNGLDGRVSALEEA